VAAELLTIAPTIAPIIVLKLGGSILQKEDDVARAVHECYRWVRQGYRVVAVVSAIGDTTDRLVAAALTYGHAPSPHAYAALVATGETISASHLWLGLDRAGLKAVSLDPRELQLRVTGPAIDATPVSVDREALHQALATASVVVVPGFVGIDSTNRLALLGRGGSDLSAIVIAHALGARCRLLKDVPGLYERDPSRPGPLARRYASVTFADASHLEGAILQRKALQFATAHQFRFEVGAPGDDPSARATVVGARATRCAMDHQLPRLRVALLGFGVVGRGVWRHLTRDSGRFEIAGIAVRNAKRHADTVAPQLLRRDAFDLASDPSIDLVIECLGGVDPAEACIAAALERGADVVTANKSLLAVNGTRFDAMTRVHGGRLAYSAAVGGAAPCLETVQRLALLDSIDSIEGVLNGTTNVILDRLSQGHSFDDALAEAQALGFAEADPSADLDGIDAAEKLRLLAHAAFGAAPDEWQVEGIRGAARPSAGNAVRLVARATRHRATVRPELLANDHPLAAVCEEWNRLVLTDRHGQRTVVDGKGAGRWPTAEAVFADVMDCWRACAAIVPAHALTGGAA